MGKKDPNAPKRGMTAFMFYMCERRPQLKAHNPDWAFGEFGKAIGAEWGQMGDLQKSKYAKQAERDKMRYAREMENYDPPIYGEEPKKRMSKAASASGGGQKRKGSGASWAEAGPLLRALPQANLLSALANAWDTGGDLRDALAKSARAGGRGPAKRVRKNGGNKKNLMCADCGEKSANYGPEGPKKLWCAGCARKRGVLTGAKARAAAEAGGPSSPQGLPSVAQQRVGWRQHWSEEDGRPYWTGPDGESTWTKPDHYA